MPRRRRGQLLQGLEILVRTDPYRHLLVAPPTEIRRPTHRSKALLEDFANVRLGSEAAIGLLRRNGPLWVGSSRWATKALTDRSTLQTSPSNQDFQFAKLKGSFRVITRHSNHPKRERTLGSYRPEADVHWLTKNPALGGAL